MDTRSVTRVAFYINFSAAHGVARRVAGISVNDDPAVVHGVAHGVLSVTDHRNLRVVEICSQRVPRRALYGNISVAHTRAYKSLTETVFERTVFVTVPDKSV